MGINPTLCPASGASLLCGRAEISKISEQLYTLEEAKRRRAEHQAAIALAEGEIRRLENMLQSDGHKVAPLDAIRIEIRSIRDMNLDNATHEEKVDVIARLGIKVYPS